MSGVVVVASGADRRALSEVERSRRAALAAVRVGAVMRSADAIGLLAAMNPRADLRPMLYRAWRELGLGAMESLRNVYFRAELLAPSAARTRLLKTRVLA